MSLKVKLLPAFKDNYIFVLCNESIRKAILVDPGESKSPLNFLKQNSYQLEAIWLTHHHWDHIGGLQDILKEFPCPVFGSDKLKQQVKEVCTSIIDQQVWRALGSEVQAIHTPGHTLNHICYYIPKESILFVGDTLFSLGCGRLFEGTPEVMWQSLKKLRALPDKTQVFCAHEYTLTNTNFSLIVDKNNPDLEAFSEEVRSKRSSLEPTIPMNLGQEKKLNLFLRADDKKLVKQLPLPIDIPEDVFAYIRELRDQF